VFIRRAICDIIGELETSGFEIDVEILWRLKIRATGSRNIQSPGVIQRDRSSSYPILVHDLLSDQNKVQKFS